MIKQNSRCAITTETIVSIVVAVVFCVAVLATVITLMVLPTVDPDTYAPLNCAEWANIVNGANCAYNIAECNYTRPCHCILPDFTAKCMQSDGTRSNYYVNSGALVLLIGFMVSFVCVGSVVKTVRDELASAAQVLPG